MHRNIDLISFALIGNQVVFEKRIQQYSVLRFIIQYREFRLLRGTKRNNHSLFAFLCPPSLIHKQAFAEGFMSDSDSDDQFERELEAAIADESDPNVHVRSFAVLLSREHNLPALFFFFFKSPFIC